MPQKKAYAICVVDKEEEIKMNALMDSTVETI
jgi:hypothetical protein